jgi:isocitrate lyase
VEAGRIEHPFDGKDLKSSPLIDEIDRGLQQHHHGSRRRHPAVLTAVEEYEAEETTSHNSKALHSLLHSEVNRLNGIKDFYISGWQTA